MNDPAGTTLTVTAGAPDHAGLAITTEDEQLHRLLTGQLAPEEAVATGAITLDGDASTLPRLLLLFGFPRLVT
jgi:putative sterol carrier protein